MKMEDTKSKTSEGKSSQIKIQDTFLEQRKVFLWGEVSDKSARDVTEKLLFFRIQRSRKTNYFFILTLPVDLLLQVWQYMIPCNWSAHPLKLLSPHGSKHGFNFTIRRRERTTCPLP